MTCNLHFSLTCVPRPFVSSPFSRNLLPALGGNHNFLCKYAPCLGRKHDFGNVHDASMTLLCLIGASLVPPWCLLGASLVPPRCILGASSHPLTWSQAPFWTHLAPTWSLLAPTWTILGPTSGNLEPSSANLGPTWANLGQLGPTWAHLQPT